MYNSKSTCAGSVCTGAGGLRMKAEWRCVLVRLLSYTRRIEVKCTRGPITFRRAPVAQAYCYLTPHADLNGLIYLFIHSFIGLFGWTGTTLNECIVSDSSQLIPPLVKSFRKQTFPYFVKSISTIYFCLHRQTRTHAGTHAHMLAGTHLKFKLSL